VRREDDKVTVWFRDHVRQHLAGTHAAQAILTFRWFNTIEAGERIADLLLHGWDRAEARRRLRGLTPVTNAAYMVNTPAGFGKLDGVLECVDLVAPHLPALVEQWGGSLEAAWSDLRQLPRVGSFVAYEAVTDLRWTPVLHQAEDINTWAAAGPGCAKGLAYVFGQPVGRYAYGTAKGQAEMLPLMQDLLALSRDPRHWPFVATPWEMREVEHWCCEYAKYRNAQAGKRLKRRYKRGGGALGGESSAPLFAGGSVADSA